MKVPRVESKLRVFSFTIQFTSQVRQNYIEHLVSFRFSSCNKFWFVPFLTSVQVSDLRKSLNTVHSAAEEASFLFPYLISALLLGHFQLLTFLASLQPCEYQIRTSAKLKRILQTILSLGNALNQGTARGELKYEFWKIFVLSADCRRYCIDLLVSKHAEWTNLLTVLWNHLNIWVTNVHCKLLVSS